MNLKDIRISTRLIVGFGALILLLVLIATSALIKINTIRISFEAVVTDSYPMIDSLHNMKDALNVVARSMRNAVLATDAAVAKKEVAQVGTAGKELGDLMKQVDTRIHTEQTRALFNQLTQVRDRYVPLRLKFAELIDAGKTDEAKLLLSA